VLIWALVWPWACRHEQADGDREHGDHSGDPDQQPGGHMVVELVVFATMFTLIVLLTGGPTNRF
jgi:hypothetical protein